MRYFIVVMMVILCCSGMAVAGQEEYSDPAKPLKFTIGQEFTIMLKSNRTTGYQWQLAEALNEGIVKLIITDYKRPEGNLIGAGGKEIWIFKAVGKGNTTITMGYVRPWEKEAAPAQIIVFRVVVN
jgi:inhibitor of cysteine peptidase